MAADTVIICDFGGSKLAGMSAYGALFGFIPLPLNYWLALFDVLLLYIPLSQFVKSWYVRRCGI